MIDDPIVDEVRAVRREIAAAAGNDLARICREAREREAANPARLAPAPPRGAEPSSEDPRERGAA